MALEREIDTYRRKLPELLPHKGEYVVIHGEEVVGFYAVLEDALRAGYGRFGDEPFLIREVREQERVLTTSRSLRPCP
jgi:hypothetical protein